jgi:hypothetical protein
MNSYIPSEEFLKNITIHDIQFISFRSKTRTSKAMQATSCIKDVDILMNEIKLRN